MELKKIYDTAGKCCHVQVLDTGTDRRQNFSARLVEQAIVDGWMSISGEQLFIKTENGRKLCYLLNATPGYYCASTGERIPLSDAAWGRVRTTGHGDLSRREALAWLEANGKPYTDYRFTMAYECTLDAAQHEQFKKVA